MMSKAQGIAQSANQSQFKNRIINGNMAIDQRSAGSSTSVTTSSTYASCDRWYTGASANNKYTVQQNAGSVTPPAGFTNYIGITSSAATSVGAADYYYLSQRIEGYNVADLGFGSANAKTVTLSFWVRSSLTGTFSVTLYNNNGDRFYPATYVINSANTWEQKTITISGDTSGTWLTNNGIGMHVYFSLGMGSNYTGTANTWSSLGYAATGATSVVGTNGATFYITGVQLEKGTVATSFDYRPYGTELALCQRYFSKSWATDIAVGTLNNNAGLVDLYYPVGGTAFAIVNVPFPVAMRTTPTVTAYDAANPPVSGKVFKGANGKTAYVQQAGNSQAMIGTLDATSANELAFYWTASAEL